MNVEPHKTYIGRLRATARDADTLAPRLRAALATLDLHPPGLPAQAIICLRHLRAPLPADILRGGAHDGARLRQWEAATADALQRMIKEAARPARAFVPAAAECVVFADRAELLSCLAADWCAGRAQTRWWWQGLFPRRDLTGAQVGLWLRELAYVPGALAHLARRGDGVRFARSLNAHEARALLDGLITHFALGDLSSVTTTMATTQSVPPAAHEADNAATTAHARPAPWQPFVPELRGEQLTAPQECLLGVGLMLQRAPSVLRSAAFARAVLRWLDEQTAPWRESAGARAPHGALSLPPSPTDTPPAAGRALSENERADADARLRAAPTSHPPTTQSLVRHEREDAAPHDALSAAGGIETATDTTATDARASLHDQETVPSPRLGAGDERESPTRAVDQTEATQQAVEATLGTDAMAGDAEITQTPTTFENLSASVVPLEAEIETGCGGVFFLLNLALFLELYGDFSRPLAPCLPLVVWDFVALLGERMLGAEVRADPVWALLAQLAGRTAGDEPGADFEPPDEWRVPTAWLAGMPKGEAWRWTAARGRLQVAHPAGFLVLDLPRDEHKPAPQQLATELRAYADIHAGALVRVARVRQPRGRTPRARLLARMTAYACARLRYALGRASARRVGRQLCALPARVAVTTTHVDVFMSLRALPVAVRLAGLDRDPGWIPAAGRFVAFHFD